MQPEELYELDTEPTPDVSGAALLVYLEGFMDAGAAGRLVTEHLLDGFEHTTVARFNTDRLLDYRSRRPLMTFNDGKWETYEAPELTVFRFTDAEGKPFLLLTGPEPDHEWEAFVAAARTLAHAPRPGVVTSKLPLPSKLQVPASASSLMEYRFGEAGKDAVGLVVQVPHYLSQAAYPTAALTLIDALTEVTGLDLPALELREAADRTNALIDRQVEESTEVAELVQGLEAQYDAAVAHDGEILLAEGEQMPTADELAAQFEQFLAEQQNGSEDEAGLPAGVPARRSRRARRSPGRGCRCSAARRRSRCRPRCPRCGL